jgi:hypothetical protein
MIVQGNVGIGTTSPSKLLHVAGDALINTMTVGLGTGSVATNTVVGYQAALNNVSGSGNTAIGYQALQNITTNTNSVAVGYQALANLTNGLNTFGTRVGGSGYVNGTYTPVQLIYSSGTTATTYPTVTIVVAGGVVNSVTKLTTGTGFRDTTTVMTAAAASIGGTGSGFTIATGTRTGNGLSTAVGYQALTSNTTGTADTAVGGSALFNNTTGSSNTAVGSIALSSNTTGGTNTAVGNSVLYSNTTGTSNMAVGSGAMYYNTTGSNNTAIGSTNAMYYNTTGLSNTAIGYQALLRNTTGSNNIAIGTNAGRYTTGATDNNATSSTSIYIGNSTGAFADGQTNQIVIGEGAIGNGSNTVTLGHTTIATTILRGNVGIGTTMPVQYGLDVAKSGDIGTARFYDQTAMTGATRVLISLGAADTPSTQVFEIGGLMKFSGLNATGSGTALLGTTSPATTNTEPYTWLTVITEDGSTGYIPVWK